MRKRAKDDIALMVAIVLLLLAVNDVLRGHKATEAYVYIGLAICLMFTILVSIKKGKNS